MNYDENHNDQSRRTLHSTRMRMRNICESANAEDEDDIRRAISIERQRALDSLLNDNSSDTDDSVHEPAD
jgi:hypothetical protein